MVIGHRTVLYTMYKSTVNVHTYGDMSWSWTWSTYDMCNTAVVVDGTVYVLYVLRIGTVRMYVGMYTVYVRYTPS